MVDLVIGRCRLKACTSCRLSKQRWPILILRSGCRTQTNPHDRWSTGVCWRWVWLRPGGASLCIYTFGKLEVNKRNNEKRLEKIRAGNHWIFGLRTVYTCLLARNGGLSKMLFLNRRLFCKIQMILYMEV